MHKKAYEIRIKAPCGALTIHMGHHPATAENLGALIERKIIEVSNGREGEVLAKGIDGRLEISRIAYLQSVPRTGDALKNFECLKTRCAGEMFKKELRDRLFPRFKVVTHHNQEIAEARIVDMEACKECCKEGGISACKSFLGMAVARAAAENPR